uniref:Vacuolar protein sorting-associated protein 54 n=1 Tax=Haemonchus placei TaxID=6290 RepID=A0A0N4WMZ1_HAEPC
LFQMLMDPFFHLSDERTFTEMFIVPPKGTTDPLTVTRCGRTVVTPSESEISFWFQPHGSFRDYMLLSASLESFHDVVDSRLSTRLVAKSAAFWQMVHSYGGLHEELADAMADIRKVRSNLQAVANLVCERARNIMSLYEKREKKQKLLAKLYDVACLREAQTTVQMLLNQSDYPKVIECIETSEEVLNSELSGVQCFRHLGSQLRELYGVIGRMMLDDFASLIQKEFGTKPEEGGELSCVLMGLIQVRRFGFMSMVRTEIMEALKGILRHEVKLHIVESGLDLTDFDPTLNQLGEPVRRLKFSDWLKTVNDVTKEFFDFCRRVQNLQDVIHESAERVRNNASVTGLNGSPFVSEDSLQLRPPVDLSSSDQDVAFGSAGASTPGDTSGDPAALLAVEIRSLPQLLRTASILTEFAHHCAQGRLCRLLIARFKVKGVPDLTSPEQLNEMITLLREYQQDCANQGWHKVEKLCLEYIERFHTQRRSKMSGMLDAELWKASEVGAEFQCLVDESLRTGRLKNVPAPSLSVGGEAVIVDSTPYVVVSSALVFLKILADYCECFVALPEFAADILSRVVELLKGFNSRCCQLILGAGALQLVGLKTISVRNLALASRSLQLIVHFVPFVAHEAELSLKEDQKHLLRHFKQVLALTDYGDHIKEITSKLVSVIDHHTTNCLNNVVPSSSFQQICRQMQKFHNGLAGIIPDDQIKSLFETVHEHFKGNLKLHLARIGISPHDSLKYGFVSQDYAFYAQSLRAMSSCSDLNVESLNDVIYGR